MHAKGFLKKHDLIITTMTDWFHTNTSTMGKYDVKVCNSLSPEHEQALTDELGVKWTKLVKKMLRKRPLMTIFEFWLSGNFEGGIIMTKMLTDSELLKDVPVPAVCIESIVSANPSQGTGSAMFGFAQMQLFSHSSDWAPYGFVFAQCVDTEFWEVCHT